MQLTHQMLADLDTGPDPTPPAPATPTDPADPAKTPALT